MLNLLISCLFLWFEDKKLIDMLWEPYLSALYSHLSSSHFSYPYFPRFQFL